MGQPSPLPPRRVVVPNFFYLTAAAPSGQLSGKALGRKREMHRGNKRTPRHVKVSPCAASQSPLGESYNPFALLTGEWVMLHQTTTKICKCNLRAGDSRIKKALKTYRRPHGLPPRRLATIFSRCRRETGDINMMRIAVAGGGGLGYMLATGISQAANAYNVIILSRYVGLAQCCAVKGHKLILS